MSTPATSLSSAAPPRPMAEIPATAASGWLMLAVNLGLLALSILLFIVGIVQRAPVLILPAIGLFIGAIILLRGHFTLEPNEARVLVLFGAYKGTVRESGFYWANPFYSRGNPSMMLQAQAANHAKGDHGAANTANPLKPRFKVSLRAHNMNTEKLKVNDKRGNPIEIAAVVVWRVADTAQAIFQVEDYHEYVNIQSESALRHLASNYAYDYGEEHETTLRGGGDDVAEALKRELQERLQKAGVVVDEARITHLAYAPEIAQAMLRRQQAEAVIAARQKIVQGAVSMVDMALRELSERAVVQLDDERKAAMVSNLLVVLCGESEASPVINTGTLYN